MSLIIIIVREFNCLNGNNLILDSPWHHLGVCKGVVWAVASYPTQVNLRIGGYHVYVFLSDLDAILWNVTYICLYLLVSDCCTCLMMFSTKRACFLYKCPFNIILIACHHNWCILIYLLNTLCLIH